MSEIRQYVKELKKKGYNSKNIYENLLSSGYSEKNAKWIIFSIYLFSKKSLGIFVLILILGFLLYIGNNNAKLVTSLESEMDSKLAELKQMDAFIDDFESSVIKRNAQIEREKISEEYRKIDLSDSVFRYLNIVYSLNLYEGLTNANTVYRLRGFTISYLTILEGHFQAFNNQTFTEEEVIRINQNIPSLAPGVSGTFAVSNGQYTIDYEKVESIYYQIQAEEGVEYRLLEYMVVGLQDSDECDYCTIDLLLDLNLSEN